jgi:hypothetical protein
MIYSSVFYVLSVEDVSVCHIDLETLTVSSLDLPCYNGIGSDGSKTLYIVVPEFRYGYAYQDGGDYSGSPDGTYIHIWPITVTEDPILVEYQFQGNTWVEVHRGKVHDSNNNVVESISDWEPFPIGYDMNHWRIPPLPRGVY